MAEELEDMIRRLHAAAETSTDERRVASRVRRNGVITIHVPGPGGEALPINVRFRDCSASGIGLLSDVPMETGTSFTISVNHPTRGLLPIPYEVVRCQIADESTFIVGARVIRG